MENEKRFYIPMTSKNVLCSISRKENIEKELWHEIRQVVKEIKKIAGSLLRSVVLRGSVAYGGFHKKLSDLDLVIFLKKTDTQMQEKIEQLSVAMSEKYSDLFSLVDLSVESFEDIATSIRCHRLWLNLKLTGITVEGEDVIGLLPDCIADIDTAKKIYMQTVMDSEECLAMIQNKQCMQYMGKKRGSEFLCVWYMRNMIRGFTALILREKGIFTMHLTTCCFEMSRLFPEKRKLIEKVWRAEREPLMSWEELRALAESSLAMYQDMWEGMENAETRNSRNNAI